MQGHSRVVLDPRGRWVTLQSIGQVIWAGAECPGSAGAALHERVPRSGRTLFSSAGEPMFAHVDGELKLGSPAFVLPAVRLLALRPASYPVLACHRDRTASR